MVKDRPLAIAPYAMESIGEFSLCGLDGFVVGLLDVVEVKHHFLAVGDRLSIQERLQPINPDLLPVGCHHMTAQNSDANLVQRFGSCCLRLAIGIRQSQQPTQSHCRQCPLSHISGNHWERWCKEARH